MPRNRPISRSEEETQRRIRVSVWAYAYEVLEESIVDDHTYDAEARLIDLSIATGNKKMDNWFKKNFTPDSGMWIHKHPDMGRLRYSHKVMTQEGAPRVTNPLVQQLLADIDTHSVAGAPPKHSYRLSPSSLGEECERFLYNKFRWVLKEQVPGRIARLFTRGHGEEDKVISMLRGVGFTVYDKDPARLESRFPQFRVQDLEGHLSGYLDGVCSHPVYTNGLWANLEVKTYNDKRFKQLVKNGVGSQEPKYYGQCAIYVKKMNLMGTVFVAVNKNDDDIHIEFLLPDHDHADFLINKGAAIIGSNVPPMKIADSPTYFKCRTCAFNPICHANAPYEVNCRSCKHGVPGVNQTWFCNLYQQVCSDDLMKVGCPQHVEAR